jgi:hypothetical protein
MHEVVEGSRSGRRVRVERGIYRQPNGKYAIGFMLDGKPRFRTVGGDFDSARAARARLVIAAQAGLVTACPRLTLGTVARRWLQRFETMVAMGERRPRTLENRRYHLEDHLLPVFAGRRIAAITVDDVAGLIGALAEEGRAQRTIAGAWRRSERSCAMRCVGATSPITRCDGWSLVSGRVRFHVRGTCSDRMRLRGCSPRARLAWFKRSAELCAETGDSWQVERKGFRG